MQVTVVQNLKQTIASLKSVGASFELFSYETKDKDAETAFQDAQKETESLIQTLETRLMQIEKEEPQYKTAVQQQYKS